MAPTPIAAPAQKEEQPPLRTTCQPESLASLLRGSQLAPVQLLPTAPLPTLGTACDSDDGEVSDTSDDGMLSESPRPDPKANAGHQVAKVKPSTALEATEVDPKTVPPLVVPSPCRGRSRSRGHAREGQTSLTANLLRVLAEEEAATAQKTRRSEQAPTQSNLGVPAKQPDVLPLSSLLGLSSPGRSKTAQASGQMLSAVSPAVKNGDHISNLPSPLVQNSEIQDMEFALASPERGDSPIFRDGGDTPIFRDDDGGSAFDELHSPGCTPCSSPCSPFNDNDLASPACSPESSPMLIGSLSMSPSDEGAPPQPAVQSEAAAIAATEPPSEAHERLPEHVSTSQAPSVAPTVPPSALPAAPDVEEQKAQAEAIAVSASQASQAISCPAAAYESNPSPSVAPAPLTMLPQEADPTQLGTSPQCSPAQLGPATLTASTSLTHETKSDHLGIPLKASTVQHHTVSAEPNLSAANGPASGTIVAEDAEAARLAQADAPAVLEKVEAVQLGSSPQCSPAQVGPATLTASTSLTHETKSNHLEIPFKASTVQPHTVSAGSIPSVANEPASGTTVAEDAEAARLAQADAPAVLEKVETVQLGSSPQCSHIDPSPAELAAPETSADKAEAKVSNSLQGSTDQPGTAHTMSDPSPLQTTPSQSAQAVYTVQLSSSMQCSSAQPSLALSGSPSAESALPQQADNGPLHTNLPHNQTQPSPASPQVVPKAAPKTVVPVERLVAAVEQLGHLDTPPSAANPPAPVMPEADYSPAYTTPTHSPDRSCPRPAANPAAPVTPTPAAPGREKGSMLPTKQPSPTRAESDQGMPTTCTHEAEVKQEIEAMMKGLAESKAKRKRQEEESSSEEGEVSGYGSPCTSVTSRHRRRRSSVKHVRRIRRRVRSSAGRRSHSRNGRQRRWQGAGDSDYDAAIASDAAWRGRGPPRWNRHCHRRRHSTRRQNTIQHAPHGRSAARSCDNAKEELQSHSSSTSTSPSRCTMPDRSRSPANIQKHEQVHQDGQVMKRGRTQYIPFGGESQFVGCEVTNVRGEKTKVVNYVAPDATAREGINVREVYVGRYTNVDGSAPQDIRAAFEAHFNELPEFRAAYPSGVSPVHTIKPPSNSTVNAKCFVFVEFLDATLASTAVAMSGMMVRGCSVKIGRPADGPKEEEAVPGLDVTRLREELKLPYRGGPGARMMLDVYIGTCFGVRLDEIHEWNLRDGISKAMLDHPLVGPAVQDRFPGMTSCVDSLKMGEAGKYAFVIMSNEVLASTLVAMAEVRINKDMVICTGWPKTFTDAGARAPLSLVKPEGINRLLVQDPPPQVNKSRDKADYDIHIGCTRGLDSEALVEALEKALNSLPAYKEAYPGEVAPVTTLRTGRGAFAFARMLDPVLASTLVAMATLEVCGRVVTLGRPEMYRKTAAQGAKPLEIPKALPAIEDANRPVAAPLRRSAFGPSMNRKPPTPPRPPSQQQRAYGIMDPNVPRTLWVGNINWDKLDSRLLETFLTELAIEAPIFDVEGGPPISRVHMNCARGYAFVELRDAKLGERLIPVFNGAQFYGRPLVCRWAKTQRFPHEGIYKPEIGQLPECVEVGKPSDDEHVDPDEL